MKRRLSSGISRAFMVAVVLFSMIAFFAPACGLQQVSTTTETAVAVGTKKRYLWSMYGYIFLHNASISVQSSTIADWTFDRIEIDFGSCEAEGITALNVSQILAINGGRIQEWREG